MYVKSVARLQIVKNRHRVVTNYESCSSVNEVEFIRSHFVELFVTPESRTLVGCNCVTVRTGQRHATRRRHSSNSFFAISSKSESCSPLRGTLLSGEDSGDHDVAFACRRIPTNIGMTATAIATRPKPNVMATIMISHFHWCVVPIGYRSLYTLARVAISSVNRM